MTQAWEHIKLCVEWAYRNTSPWVCVMLACLLVIIVMWWTMQRNNMEG